MTHAMSLVAALEVVARLRTDQVVVTTMGSAREWPKLSQHPLDFHYIPSAMGQSPLIALGIAFARPERQVIAFTGDGSLLMNLGCLVTIAAANPANLTVIALENRVYEVTGGQKTAGAVANVDFAAAAAAAGLVQSHHFDELDTWSVSAPIILTGQGPRFVSLEVKPVEDDFHVVVPGPMRPRIAAFRQALAS